VKRFYQQATIAPADDGHAVHLDGRAIRTPAKAPLIVPTAPLAEAIAAEWQGQGEQVLPESMPLMRLSATAIDQIARNRAAVVEAVAAYAHTDLLCYRSDTMAELEKLQHAQWQPILDWAALRFDAPLMVVAGIMPRPQPASAVAALTRAVEGLDVFILSGVQNAVGALGSLVLTLALLEARVDAETAFELSELDALYQAKRWGEDAEAAVRRADLRADIHATARFLTLLRG
jgi:chaperone required for assembly of F1-ATPase